MKINYEVRKESASSFAIVCLLTGHVAVRYASEAEAKRVCAAFNEHLKG